MTALILLVGQVVRVVRGRGPARLCGSVARCRREHRERTDDRDPDTKIRNSYEFKLQPESRERNLERRAFIRETPQYCARMTLHSLTYQEQDARQHLSVSRALPPLDPTWPGCPVRRRPQALMRLKCALRGAPFFISSVGAQHQLPLTQPNLDLKPLFCERSSTALSDE